MRPSDKRRTRARTARLETFEPRELLSAVPVYDFWLDDQQHPETGLYADLNPAMTNAHALTGLDQARAAYGLTGAGQTVAVIDTGIAYSHYALGGGYGPGYRVVGGWDFTKASPNAFDNGPYGSHGTHVAGIIGSSDSVYTGVAPEVDLVALRVFDDNGGGYFSWVEQALWWVHENRFAFENPITAVNLSLGASYNAASLPSWAMLETALAQLKADGIFVAVAAGNSFAQYNAPGLSYPAVSPRVVAVGSVAGNGLLSSFSQRHTSMIAAPGQSIMSTVPDYVGNYNGVHDDFARYSGTSMATPYVAGASVLLREAYAFAGIANVNQAALYNAMYTTADTFFDAATQQTYRRLNLQAAIDTIMPADDYGSTAATAHAMGTLASDLSLTGHISRLDDVDWFQFTAGAAGTVTVTVNPTLSLAPKWSINGFAVSAGNGGRSITFDVVAGQTYRFGLATSDGLGHYSLSAGLNGGANPGTLLDVLVADFTGNGMDDIVGRSAHDGTWWMAVNHGNGVFTNERWTGWNPNVELVDVMTADFTGDGKADIAGRVAGTGDWWVAASTGTGFTNAKWTRWNPNLELVDVMAADFTGDGKADIAGR
ncbi:MAG: S8 family serine peptidase, partial [Thermoguttaceae bacterium]|nr:S8 family serine peptidase [Thermoguttaceae bacterium]